MLHKQKVTIESGDAVIGLPRWMEVMFLVDLENYEQISIKISRVVVHKW